MPSIKPLNPVSHCFKEVVPFRIILPAYVEQKLLELQGTDRSVKVFRLGRYGGVARRHLILYLI